MSNTDAPTTEPGPGHDPLFSLTPQMLIAIDRLVTGATQAAAARDAGVARETVNRWCRNHPEFIAELNRRRKDLYDANADIIRYTDRLALESMAGRVQSGDPDAAEAWVKLRGINRMATGAIGPTDADEYIDDIAEGYRAAARSEARQHMTEQQLGYDSRVLPDLDSFREAAIMRLRIATDTWPVNQHGDGGNPIHWDADVFASTPEEAAAVDADGPPACSGLEPVPVPNMTPLDLAFLEEVLPGGRLPDGEDQPLGDPDANWGVFPLSSTFAERISKLTDEQLPQVAAAWTQTEGYANRLTVSESSAAIEALRCAAQALEPTQNLYMWMGPAFIDVLEDDEGDDPVASPHTADEGEDV